MKKEYNIYYIYGDVWQVEGAVRTIKKSILKNEDNLVEFKGKVDSASIVTASRLSTFGGGKKLVIVRNFEGFNFKDFSKYFENPNTDTCLVFVNDNNELKIPKNLKEAFDKHGKVLNYRKVYNKDAPAYIRKIFNHYNKTIGQKEISLIVNYIGSDLMELSSEIEKLTIYVGDRKYVNTEDIINVLEKSRVGSVFELINYISSKQRQKALALYKQLIDSGQGEFSILKMLNRHMKQMSDVKKMLALKVGAEEIGKELKIPSYFIKDTMQKSRNLSWERIKNMYKLVTTAEDDLKYKKTSNRVIMERLIIDLC